MAVLFISQFLFGQNSENLQKEHPLAVYLESPLFYRDWNGNSNSGIITANLEYLLKTSEINRVSFSLGAGREFLIKDYHHWDIVIFSEVSNVFGKRTHFFEAGLGPCYASGSLMIKMRLGYRLQLANRFLFRLGYTPYLWPKTHYNYEDQPEIVSHSDLSISLGYRFGLNYSKKQSQGDGLFKHVVHSVLLDFQPFYQNYDAAKGNLKSLKIEIILKEHNRVNFLFSAGIVRTLQHYNYGLKTHDFVFTISFTTLYGIKGRYIEAGINFTGPVKWRNISFNYLQPNAGYRQYFFKRIYAHLLYSPYFWLSNKENRTYIKKDFMNSFTVGLGYKF